MARIRNLFKLISFLISLLLIACKSVNGQLLYQPYSYDFYQKLTRETYNYDADFHTSLKPFIFPNNIPLTNKYDSLLHNGQEIANQNWLHKIIFTNHLIDYKKSNYTFWLDFLPDFQIGKEFSTHKKTYLNTRGYQLFASIGQKFFFYSSGYENQGSFANYENTYINNTGIVPGQAYGRNNSFSTADDWAYVTTLIGFKANKKLTVVLGQDKTFIGDGYRSLLLSDFASNYPLLRITYDFNKKLQYMAMWTEMQDQNAPKLDTAFDYRNNRRKFALFHYLDWNVSSKFSMGFFNAIVAEEANDKGMYHGFDINYLNLLFLTSNAETVDNVTDHVFFGLNTHYRAYNNAIFYGQLLVDNDPFLPLQKLKVAYQIGIKGWNFLDIPKLNYLIEYNTASPYTYSGQYQILNYTQFAEPLAHPYGANFKELLSIINYSRGKFDFRLQIDLANYGLNINNVNYGKDITHPFNMVNYTGPFSTGQGLATNLKYSEATVSYLINPAYNLRFELNALLRQESNIQSITKTALITVGLRSSFRNLYHDF